MGFVLMIQLQLGTKIYIFTRVDDQFKFDSKNLNFINDLCLN